MSAMYKCNWCGKKLTAHSHSRNVNFEMPKEAPKNNISKYLKVSLSISVGNHDLDICDKCMKKAKKRAVKEFDKIEL